ncbi:MAG: glycosyltransferase family 39 protein [Verrucomicrobia bacterium]|nr:glycosyltransferase family 39 protein [Verrucomicrobiota bacterium]
MTALFRSPFARWAAAILFLGTIFRLWYSMHLELVGDEAYYWLWSRHPDFCYLDKGPVIAWFMSAGTALFGQTVFGIRFFATLLALGTGIGIFLLARRLFSDQVAFWSVLLATVTPLFAVGATLMTIDTVYVFFWTFAALAFWYAKDQSQLGWWILTGSLVGLSMLSKYTGAIELLSFVGFCAWHPPCRQHFRRATLPAMLVVVALFFIPVLLWNWQHGFPTSHFLVHRGALDEGMRFRPLEVLSFVGQQAAVISPVLFLGLLAALFWPRLAPTSREQIGYLLALFLPLFLGYLVLSFQKASQANWAAGAYISGLVLTAAKWCEAVRLYPWARWIVSGGLALALLQTAILHETSWLHLPARLDPLDRARGSRNLAAQVEALKIRSHIHVVIAQKYMTAALLSFYLPEQPETFMPVSSPPFNQLVLWPTYREIHPDDDAIYVSNTNQLPASLEEDFPDIRPAGEIYTSQDGRQVNHFYLFVCRRSDRHLKAAAPK